MYCSANSTPLRPLESRSSVSKESMRDLNESSPETGTPPKVVPEEGVQTMFCTQCGTKNGSDANFCKQCGRRLDRPAVLKLTDEQAAELEQPEEKVDRLLAAAFKARKAGEMEAAIAACEEAIAIRPESTSAHSLLGILYERQGEREKAVAQFERVLELNPGSIADREKLEQLKDSTTSLTPRKIISNHHAPSAGKAPRPWLPVAVAAAVFIIVLLAGSWAMLGHSVRPTRASGGAPLPRPVSIAQAPQTAQPTASTPAPKATASIDPYAAWGSLMERAYANAAARPQVTESRPRPQESSREVPPAPILIQPQDLKARPNSVPPTLRPESDGVVHLPEGGTSGGAPEPGTTSAQPLETATAPPGSQAQRNLGKISIIVSEDTPSGRAVSTASANGNSSGSMDSRNHRAIAQQAQMQGNYPSAIKEYSRALDGAGDDSAFIHQQIALCYQRLDQRDSAITHYRDAIAEYNKQIAAGRNVESAKRGIRFCDDGIRVCQ